MNENQLVQQVLSGNSSAFGYFVEKYQDTAITIAWRICKNMQDAEDVVQDSFVKAYRNLHSFRKESKFSTWLYRIVYNTAITFIRSQKYTTGSENELSNIQTESEFNTQKQILEKEAAETVENILKQIPDSEALMLTLFYLEDNSVRDIAKITGLNISNVKVKLFRARQSFKKTWEKQYKKPDF